MREGGREGERGREEGERGRGEGEGRRRRKEEREKRGGRGGRERRREGGTERDKEKGKGGREEGVFACGNMTIHAKIFNIKNGGCFQLEWALARDTAHLIQVWLQLEIVTS